MSKDGWQLTTAKKKEILLNNIHGVDIDAQAVEVTKLSLLLKVLEGENDETIGSQLALFKERVLPDLGDNIKCGNSLIGPDYWEGRMMADEEERHRVNAFDWKAEFPAVFGQGGFDVVIGNPPYVFGGNYGIGNDDKQYFKAQYKCGSKKVNLFTLFLERAVNLLAQNGLASYIVPNTLLRVTSYSEVREFLLRESLIRQLSTWGRAFSLEQPQVPSSSFWRGCRSL